ncbi:MAG: DUF1837 domain-containing protein [Candidatus Hydrogenedentes bacterium]|nr:DUF1837 domain-containing protein [Candidatus Hydrogenedentota bacterium]
MLTHPKPDAFLTVRAHNIDVQPSLSGLCAGYERGSWRTEGLADHLMDWLPEFALSATECEDLRHQNATKLIRRAAKRVYESEKFRNRGEFGELLLHIAIRQVFDSLPAVSKIYYKSARNETVKGFDAVHVVGPPDDLELWLGEAKFYDDIGQAIHDVVAELQAHTDTDYLRDEFALIVNKIDPKWPHAERLRKLLEPETSLDQVFQRACIPVLLTYDSPCVAKHTTCDSTYVRAFESEILTHHKNFSNRKLPREIRIHLFLMPLKEKVHVLQVLDQKLKAWQKI